ncbi:GNAT family N-acetyltransferase [Shinella zoogloeoides]|uniref:GNAT family N-acetyltransferase n=1 Tax=Shinella zoogloeoides TaxID=352475 RepID=UPI001F59FBDC|nr:GNAT family N-acetyltransferase [Shinella zoogloeoides]
MSTSTYLIDTNVIIHLEDNRTVEPAFSAFINLASKHKFDIFVHESACDDIRRDKNVERRAISLSKIQKFQSISKVRGLTVSDLKDQFGPLNKHNDIVDATLLHSLQIGAVDFLVTQDRGLHERARRYSAELGRRVLYVADAVQLVKTTFEPIEAPVRFIEEVYAHSIPLNDTIFDSLREDYPGFNDWWTNKCIKQRRLCWIVEDDGIAGLLVRKDEKAADTDAKTKAEKILKICTLKVRPEKRGLKLGELLLKKSFWFAQKNRYDLIYITTYDGQTSLIDLLEYFGFRHTETKEDGERIYEKTISGEALQPKKNENLFEVHRLNYPRFSIANDVEAFGIPIKENYHDILYPDLKQQIQFDLFSSLGIDGGPRRPGNTIRKVYLCRAPSNLGPPGSILLFYKGKSQYPPSQSISALGILEDVTLAHSTRELLQLAGGRSVYSERDLEKWQASFEAPVKVINYLLAAYIDPPVGLKQLKSLEIISGQPPQSIFQIPRNRLHAFLSGIDLGFSI